jgi:hypothetical protein
MKTKETLNYSFSGGSAPSNCLRQVGLSRRKADRENHQPYAGSG